MKYLHIELVSPDVLIAEGAFSERFIDEDSRGIFDNAHEYGELYPEQTVIPARYCAPRPLDGYEITAIRARLETCAGLRSAVNERPFGLRGHVDIVNFRIIAGWAQTIEHREAPVCLDIFVGGQLIGQTLANVYREDLANAGLGSGNHGFYATESVGVLRQIGRSAPSAGCSEARILKRCAEKALRALPSPGTLE